MWLLSAIARQGVVDLLEIVTPFGLRKLLFLLGIRSAGCDSALRFNPSSLCCPSPRSDSQLVLLFQSCTGRRPRRPLGRTLLSANYCVSGNKRTDLYFILLLWSFTFDLLSLLPSPSSSFSSPSCADHELEGDGMGFRFCSFASFSLFSQRRVVRDGPVTGDQGLN